MWWLVAALTISVVPPQARVFEATPKGCYDGDTCTFDLDLGMNVILRNQRVRLCDINAPELHRRATREAGRAARDFLNDLIRTSTTVQVAVLHEPQPLHDNFGRILGWIVLDGEDASDIMLRTKHARPYGRRCGR